MKMYRTEKERICEDCHLPACWEDSICTSCGCHNLEFVTKKYKRVRVERSWRNLWRGWGWVLVEIRDSFDDTVYFCDKSSSVDNPNIYSHEAM